jgi:GNAT superfamily N-acetyltransferase
MIAAPPGRFRGGTWEDSPPAEAPNSRIGRVTHGPQIDPARGDGALAARLDDAERSSNLSLWDAAMRSGARVHVIDEDGLAVAAAPDLPGPMFNQGFGFVSRPERIEQAREHFARHASTGWVWTDAPPWPGAVADADAVLAAIPVTDLPEPPLPPGVTVRELGGRETGPWADAVVEAAGLEGAVADAWRALEPVYANGPHDHRFVAEVGGRVIGTGALHVRAGVGWLRAGTVLPSHRGRGIQRALIAARTVTARRLGADVVAGSANPGGPSAANLARLGFRVAARRARYRIDAT